jgi:hypothetical protein
MEETARFPDVRADFRALRSSAIEGSSRGRKPWQEITTAFQFGRLIHHQVRSVRLFAIAGFWLMQGATAFCQAPPVPVCDALTLYGNAANSGLCQSLSTSAHWVCELANSPDIHSTFNAMTPLHITVNTQGPIPCNGLSTLTGTWNAAGQALAIAAGQPNLVCNVSIQNYVDRFNAQPRLPAGATTACLTAFNAALGNLRISPVVHGFYAALCGANACP